MSLVHAEMFLGHSNGLDLSLVKSMLKTGSKVNGIRVLDLIVEGYEQRLG